LLKLCSHQTNRPTGRKKRSNWVISFAGFRSGVITTDADSSVKTFNPAAENLTGWSSRDDYGSPLRESVPGCGQRFRRSCWKACSILFLLEKAHPQSGQPHRFSHQNQAKPQDYSRNYPLFGTAQALLPASSWFLMHLPPLPLSR